MEPLALALGCFNSKDFEVELIDERIDKLPEVFETDLVGITIETYTLNVLSLKKLENKE